MTEAGRRRLRIARFAVAAALLAWLFTRFPIHDVAGVLADADAGALVGGALLAVAGQVAASVRLTRIVRHHGFALTAVEACRVNFAAAFYGLTVPAGNLAGGAVRILRLGDGTRRLPALAAVLADRIHATYGTVLAGVLFWFADPVAALPVAGLLLLAGAVAVPLGYLLLRRGSALAARLPANWSRALGREAEVSPRETLAAVGITLAAQLLGWGAVIAAAAALDLGVPVLTLGWVRSAVMVLVLLPVTVAGFGLREGALVALLAQYGVPGEQAVAFSLLVFAVTTLPNGAIGGMLEAARLLRAAPA